MTFAMPGPTPKEEHAASTSTGFPGFSSFTSNPNLGRGDLDLSLSSLSPSPVASDPEPSCVPGLAVFPSGADSIGFTAPGVKASELAAAMKVSNLRIKAVWTLRDNPGGMYSLGILLPGISKYQLTLNALCCSPPQFKSTQPKQKKQLFSLILRCVPHTLIDDPHFLPYRPHSLLPQDACRTS